MSIGDGSAVEVLSSRSMNGSSSGSFDIAIVGGGPAGLAASVATGRMNRRAIVFEAGTPRTSHAPCYYNYLGFPDGISGEELLARGRAQAERWGAEIREAAVTAIEKGDGGGPGFALEAAGETVQAAGVVFATGVRDRQLTCGNLYNETGRGVHYCVVCDGCETKGERVAVVGGGTGAMDMVEALRDFTEDLHLLLDGERGSLKDESKARLAKWGVPVHPAPLTAYRCGPGGIAFDPLGELDPFPHVFIARGVIPSTDVAAALGCALDEEGFIVTDEYQATRVPFVYAAGDCDGGHKQVTQAMAEGEKAALELIKRLRETGVPVLG